MSAILERPVPQQPLRPKVRDAIVSRLNDVRLVFPEATVAEIVSATIVLLSRQMEGAIATGKDEADRKYNREALRQCVQILLLELADRGPEAKQ